VANTGSPGDLGPKFLITRFLPSCSSIPRRPTRSASSAITIAGTTSSKRSSAFDGLHVGGLRPRRRAARGAQERKIRRVGDRLQLKRGDRLLDIGCGWGTLALTPRRTAGVDATGVTLSSKQAEFGTARSRERKLADRARILTLDYRRHSRHPLRQDLLPGMAEHVGVRNFQRFLRQVERPARRDDGLFFLQIVALRRPPEALVVRNDRGGYWNAADFTWAMFMSKYLPGSGRAFRSPSSPRSSRRRASRSAGVENVNVALRHDDFLRWYRKLGAEPREGGSRPRRTRYRLWHLFLAWSVFTGEQGRGDCMQIVAHKSRPSSIARASSVSVT